MFDVADPRKHTWLAAMWNTGPFLVDGILIDFADGTEWIDLMLAADSAVDKLRQMGIDLAYVEWGVLKT